MCAVGPLTRHVKHLIYFLQNKQLLVAASESRLAAASSCCPGSGSLALFTITAALPALRAHSSHHLEAAVIAACLGFNLRLLITALRCCYLCDYCSSFRLPPMRDCSVSEHVRLLFQIPLPVSFLLL